jgi:GMP synthase-like glutamine amidotransferase
MDSLQRESKQKVQVFQHVPFEDLGSIAPWLNKQGILPGYTRFFAGDRLPALTQVDALIVMGGPMSVNDEEKFPWLIPEKQYIREAIRQDIPVLGICLGAQLIASALGARIYTNPVKEIGWFPVEALSASNHVFNFPAEFMAFHWHGQTFDMPEGAVQLARSYACAHQAFQSKQNVIGLQFHLETTPAGVLSLIENCRDELRPEPYIQSEQELRKVSASNYYTSNKLMNAILNYLL